MAARPSPLSLLSLPSLLPPLALSRPSSLRFPLPLHRGRRIREPLSLEVAGNAVAVARVRPAPGTGDCVVVGRGYQPSVGGCDGGPPPSSFTSDGGWTFGPASSTTFVLAGECSGRWSLPRLPHQQAGFLLTGTAWSFLSGVASGGPKWCRFGGFRWRAGAARRGWCLPGRGVGVAGMGAAAAEMEELGWKVVLKVEHWERVQVITAATWISIANCRECIFYLGINQPPLILGDNHRLQKFIV